MVEVANSASDISKSALNTDKVTNFIVKVRIDSKSYSDQVLGSSSFPFRPGMSATVDIFTSAVEKLFQFLFRQLRQDLKMRIKRNK